MTVWEHSGGAITQQEIQPAIQLAMAAASVAMHCCKENSKTGRAAQNMYAPQGNNTLVNCPTAMERTKFPQHNVQKLRKWKNYGET